jgi:copper chaperone CopZ
LAYGLPSWQPHISIFYGNDAMKITVKIKSVYGIMQAYPACPQSKIFCDLTGTKTLTRAALESIKKLGFEIEQQAQTMDI